MIARVFSTIVGSLFLISVSGPALAGFDFSPSSEFLPAVAGEPPVDFCAQWNPEFGYRGYRCCSNQVSRNIATTKKSRRHGNSCAPDRIKWTFCDEMTTPQREYIANVKSGKVDPLESIQKNMGSRGGQSFCSVSNGFLVEGRPILASANNRIEIRNEARCSNFGTDGLAGAMEWVGREIKKEFHEPEFDKARLIMGDASAPRGACIAGRHGRRAHKSHTSGVDIDVTFFNPRAGYAPEERFTNTFYVASNWWFLKKVFKNPFACVKIVFTDHKKIAMLARYAKDDPDWAKYRHFIRHTRGHKDHFHIRVGSGPGEPGCMSDPNLEEDEDGGEELEGQLAQNAEENGDGGRSIASIVDELGADKALDAGAQAADEADGAIPPTGVVGGAKPTAAGVQLAQATLPPHKLEPAISMKFQEKPRRSRAKSRKSRRR